MLSNGNARSAARVTNSATTTAGTQWGILIEDSDLRREANITYPGARLFDTIKLVFDITPTVSGPLQFQYVFGSEEYPDFAPGSGNSTGMYH